MDKFQIVPVAASALNTNAQLIVKPILSNAVRREFFVVKQDSEITEAELRAQNEGNAKKYLSFFGLPVFDTVTFKAGNYFDDDNQQVFFGQVELGIALITVTRPKYIVKTRIAGRNGGDVKEIINNGDFQFKIEGLIAAKGHNVYPEKEIADLLAMAEAPQAIEVAGPVFQRLGVANIVIEDIELTPEEGTRNIQRFQLKACSDFPFELKTTNSL